MGSLATEVNESDFASRRLHFVGIGGAGMSGLALVAHQLGARVSGSDRSDSSYLRRLRSAGIDAKVGHAAENVPPDAEVIYSTAIPEDNPERVAAAGRELHRADLLAELASLRRCIAVTGTHGKTTTSAMIFHILERCGHDPSYLLGGELRSTGSNAGWGGGDWLVVEADESDRSLLKLSPEIAVLTSAELDHHTTYGSRLELQTTLSAFMRRVGDHGVVWDRPELRALCSDEAVAYDVADPVLHPGGSKFRYHGLEVTLSVPGLHNAINAAGAIAACSLAGVEVAPSAQALEDFQGARRRLEYVGESSRGALVYDDYAHHPTEIAAAIAAARTLEPRRLAAVLQPHLYSRTRALVHEFGRALAGADLTVVLAIYPSRERAEDYPGVDGRLIAAAAADAADGRTVAWLPEFEQARGFLEATLRAGDVCLMMGAGNIYELSRSLVISG